ncbi:Bor/Iss family lipoprotein [Litoribacillus peritrichatus]|uniref:Lipoprotein n=1 Tax=Litoribacillus peritrichatus TaxID=718191 RepID=A0ABP7N8L2_9GAMM
MKLLTTLVSLIILSACTTIHFDNGEPIETLAKTEQWHHNVALDLVEVSDAVNLERRCLNQEWTSVKTELSFLNGLARLAVNWIAPIWYPKTVEISCDFTDKKQPSAQTLKL